MVCRNPLLAADRARKRDELLAATEKELAKIQAQMQSPRKPLRGKDAIGMAVGKVIGHYKVGNISTLSSRMPAFVVSASRLRSISKPLWTHLRDPNVGPNGSRFGRTNRFPLQKPVHR